MKSFTDLYGSNAAKDLADILERDSKPTVRVGDTEVIVRWGSERDPFIPPTDSDYSEWFRFQPADDGVWDIFLISGPGLPEFLIASTPALVERFGFTGIRGTIVTTALIPRFRLTGGIGEQEMFAPVERLIECAEWLTGKSPEPNWRIEAKNSDADVERIAAKIDSDE